MGVIFLWNNLKNGIHIYHSSLISVDMIYRSRQIGIITPRCAELASLSHYRLLAQVCAVNNGPIKTVPSCSLCGVLSLISV